MWVLDLYYKEIVMKAATCARLSGVMRTVKCQSRAIGDGEYHRALDPRGIGEPRECDGLPRPSAIQENGAREWRF